MPIKYQPDKHPEWQRDATRITEALHGRDCVRSELSHQLGLAPQRVAAILKRLVAVGEVAIRDVRLSEHGRMTEAYYLPRTKRRAA